MGHVTSFFPLNLWYSPFLSLVQGAAYATTAFRQPAPGGPGMPQPGAPTPVSIIEVPIVVWY